MFDINLLYPEKQSGKYRSYGFAGDMIKDLNLSVIFQAMADRDEFIYQSCKNVMLGPIEEEKILRFRQQMVGDAIHHASFYEGAYRLATKAVEEIEKNKGEGSQRKREQSKIQQIYTSLELLLIEAKYLGQIKDYMRTEEAERSDGMVSFTRKLREFCSDDFVEVLQEEISKISVLLKGGRLVITAGIGGGMKCSEVVINRLEPFDYRNMNAFRRALRWLMIRFFSPEAVRLTDTALVQEAAQMETNSLHYMLEVFQKPIREFQDFFEQLRYQLGFYVGCANLYRKLSHLHMKVSFPQVSKTYETTEYQDLYELSMALTTLKMPVSNSISDDCHLHVISGANQGGKSTFLRSVGIAQVMMQAGLFVPATYFVSPLYDTILTHFTRREDSSMNSGRLVEEMKRMNHIINVISKKSMILMNESFSSTTEKEGSLVAESIIQAMFDCGVTVWMVTHLFAFANRMYQKDVEGMRFLSAERKEDGRRTFKMLEHEPTETSYGLDLYEELINMAVQRRQLI